MAISFDATKGFRDPKFGFKNDTRNNRTLVPTLARNAEFIRVPVAGISNHF